MRTEAQHECHVFAPADAETAGEPEQDPEEPCYCGCAPEAHMGRPQGCQKHGFHMYIRTSYASGEDREAARAVLRRIAEKPEAPEELPPCRSCGKRVETWFDRSVCAEPCESMHDRCSACGVTVTPCPNAYEPPAPAPAAPRPPYAVAYATGSGALNRIALPGSARVAVVDGSLVISHASGVLGIAEVEPLEN